MTQPLLCLSTCPDHAEARQLAALLVEQKQAACVTIVPGCESVYEWQGEVQQDQEWLLLIKTSQDKLESLQQLLLAQHSYDVPELIALPITDGLPAYLKWLSSTLKLPTN